MITIFRGHSYAPKLALRPFFLTVFITSFWINISEVFRYFVIVMQENRRFLSSVPNVADMNWGVFAIWGMWDTLFSSFVVVIAVFWRTFAPNDCFIKAALIAGTVAWTLFLLFWLSYAVRGFSIRQQSDCLSRP